MTDTNDTPTPNMRPTPGKEILPSRTRRPLPAPLIPQPYLQDFMILASKEHYIQAKVYFFKKAYSQTDYQIPKNRNAGIISA